MWPKAVRRQTTLAMDCRMEYCQSQVGFLANGTLLLRANVVPTPKGMHLRNARELAVLPEDVARSARHSLWLVDNLNAPQLRPVDVLAGEQHGTYDCCSSLYD